MRILIIYIQSMNRKTITDSIKCFQKYQKKYETYFYFYNPKVNILPIVKRLHFDIVIFHNTFPNLLWDKEKREDVFRNFNGLWENSARAVFFQDEYAFCNANIEFINRMNIDVIFTLAKMETAKIFYPEKRIGKRKIVRVLTGYVDDATLKSVLAMGEVKRDIDIGYRANRTNYSLGQLGALKSLITEKFQTQKREFPELTFDVKNTYGKKNLFQGMEWYEFLKRCRTMVGCLGGSSILDEDGVLYAEFLRYKYQMFSQKTFEKLQTILDQYEKLDYAVISPRCLECAMTRTCQLLIEGDYEIMKPGVHYIEIKDDFSNLHEVIEKVKDENYCKEMAKRAFEDLIQSRRYTYRKYVRFVIKTMEPFIRKSGNVRWNSGFIKLLFFMNNQVNSKHLGKV